MSRAWIFEAGFLLIFTGISYAQDKPLTVDGTLSSGFYSTSSRGGDSGDQGIKFAPMAGQFEINSYYLTPDLLDLWVKPELDAGPQASEAGIQGGNGVQLRITALRKRAFPLTLRYSNVQFENLYSGSLSQLSSYTVKSRNRDLGFATELSLPGLPTASFDWGVGSVASQSVLAANPAYESHIQHRNLDSQYVRWGWHFDGFVHHQEQKSDMLTSTDQSARSSDLTQRVTRLQGSGRRNLPWDSELTVDAGRESTSNIVLNRPIDLTTRFSRANLRLLQKNRWKTSLRAGYTSNISGLLLSQFLGSLAGNGSVAPDASIFAPLQRTISNFNLNALTSLELSHGFSLYGSADRTAVLAARSSGLRSTYFTTAGGVSYIQRFDWGTFSGQYGHELGAGSVTDQKGKIDGRNYGATFQHGNGNGLQFDFSAHAVDQSVRNVQRSTNQSLRWDGNVARRIFGPLSVRIGGGWQQSAFTSASAETGANIHSSGYTARAGIELPRFQINASLNDSVGNSLQAYSQTLGGIGVESALLNAIHLVASDVKGMSASVHTNPIRKLDLAVSWTHSTQHLENALGSNLDFIDAHATYHFRRLDFESGYYRTKQMLSNLFGIYPESQRGRFYIRVSRSFRLL